MSQTSLKDLIHHAEEQHVASKAANAAVSAHILASMSALIPPGTVIDLRTPAKERPEYLLRVKTTHGNDRGTRVFRVIRVDRIEFKPGFPELAEWAADSIPISEKTGKDMDGSVAGSSSNIGKTVRIMGRISVERGFDEPTSTQMERMLTLLDSAV